MTPRDLDQREAILDQVGRSAAAAVGAERVFFVGPGEERLLRSVARSADSADGLINVLLQGTTDDEQTAQFTSAIPAGTQLLSARSQGQVLVIDLTDEVTELTGTTLAEALAQVVYTASEIDGIEAVEIRVNGAERSWPTPTGENKITLRTYDYPAAVKSAQPAFPTLAGAG